MIVVTIPNIFEKVPTLFICEYGKNTIIYHGYQDIENHVKERKIKIL
jgi:hypothetical protein